MTGENQKPVGTREIFALLSEQGQRERYVDPYSSPDATCVTIRQLARALKVTRNEAVSIMAILRKGKIPREMTVWFKDGTPPEVKWVAHKTGGGESMRLMVASLSEHGKELAMRSRPQPRQKGNKTKRLTLRLSMPEYEALDCRSKESGVPIPTLVHSGTLLVSQGPVQCVPCGTDLCLVGQGGEILAVVAVTGQALTLRTVDAVEAVNKPAILRAEQQTEETA